MEGECGASGQGGYPPALRLGQRGIPGPGSAYLARQGGPQLPVRHTHPLHCWAPQELFQMPGRDSTHLARQGHGPAHRVLSARPP